MGRFRFLLPLCLFAVFPVLSLYSVHAHYAPLTALLAPLLVSLLFSLLLYFILRRLFEDTDSAFLSSLFVLLLFYSWGPITHILNASSIFIGKIHLGAYAVLTPVYAAITALFIVLRERGLRLLRRLSGSVLPVALLLLSVPVVAIIHEKIRRCPAPVVAGALSVRTGAGPDMFYIVLDAYTRNDVLRDLFQLDNTPFYSALRERGFFVVGRSRANYQNTGLALSSALNLDYIKTTGPIDKIAWIHLIHRLHTNRVFRFLRSAGYRILAFDASGWEVMKEADVDDYERTPGYGPEEFLAYFLVKTPFGGMPLPFVNANQVMYQRHRECVLHAFQYMGRKEHFQNGPWFIFGHVLIPHSPFVFDSTGNPLDNFGRPFLEPPGFAKLINRPKYASGYRGQVQYANRLTLALVDSLLARNPVPVIILQSDHGSGMRRDPETLEYLELRERLSNFTAVYFPDSNYAGWDDTLSPVNTFRLVFNKYFKTGYERLPDRSYFLPKSNPGKMVDVTDSLFGKD